MPLFRTLTLAFFTIAALSGCGSSLPPGKGPITLSGPAQFNLIEHFQNYAGSTFAVSPDGQSYGSSYCIADRCIGEDSGAVETCNARGERKDCQKLSEHPRLDQHKIVWDGPVKYTALEDVAPTDWCRTSTGGTLLCRVTAVADHSACVKEADKDPGRVCNLVSGERYWCNAQDSTAASIGRYYKCRQKRHFETTAMVAAGRPRPFVICRHPDGTSGISSPADCAPRGGTVILQEMTGVLINFDWGREKKEFTTILQFSAESDIVHLLLFNSLGYSCPAQINMKTGDYSLRTSAIWYHRTERDLCPIGDIHSDASDGVYAFHINAADNSIDSDGQIRIFYDLPADTTGLIDPATLFPN